MMCIIKTVSIIATLSNPSALIAKNARRSCINGGPAEAENLTPQHCRSSLEQATLGRWNNYDA